MIRVLDISVTSTCCNCPVEEVISEKLIIKYDAMFSSFVCSGCGHLCRPKRMLYDTKHVTTSELLAIIQNSYLETYPS